MRLSDPHVWHFILTRGDQDVERLETMCIEPDELARLGTPAVLAGVEAARRKWARVVIAKLGEGHGVRVHRERGYVRSIYPGVALKAAPTAAAGQGGRA